MMRSMSERPEFLIRARTFLDGETTALSEQPELDGEGSLRLRLLVRWTGDVLGYEAGEGIADSLELDKRMEELESDLEELRAAREDAGDAEYALEGEG
jgi:hypothetical protein